MNKTVNESNPQINWGERDGRQSDSLDNETEEFIKEHIDYLKKKDCIIIVNLNYNSTQCSKA